jgi:hypothetical protein
MGSADIPKATNGGHHQASSPSFSQKVPVALSSPMIAMRKTTSAPFSTGWPAPLKGDGVPLRAEINVVG